MPGPFVDGAGIRLERRRSGLRGVYDGVYGVIPVGRGEPEGGIGSLKIGEKIEISASSCGSGGEFCREILFLSFRQLENCRLGNFFVVWAILDAGAKRPGKANGRRLLVGKQRPLGYPLVRAQGWRRGPVAFGDRPVHGR